MGFPGFAIWVGLVAAFWGPERPERKQLNTPILRKPGKSHTGGSGDRFKPYREVSVDRNTATRTQTPKQGREGRKAGRENKKTIKNSENLVKLRDPAPTREVSV
jgi:hypothetical protein